jgi:hypothetical protein
MLTFLAPFADDIAIDDLILGAEVRTLSLL